MDKEKLYRLLGASWFQKVVFKVEDLKFKFIDRFCPNIDNWYCNYCDKRVHKLCLKVLILRLFSFYYDMFCI